MNKIITFLIIATCLFSCKEMPRKTQEPVAGPAADSLTAVLDKIAKEGHFNGFGVAMVDDKGLLYQKGFGYADAAAKKEYTQNTVQNIASVSKTVIGLALLKAQEMGKLKMTDPVNKYLPFEVVNPAYPHIEITLQQLATHTSTLRDADVYFKKGYVLDAASAVRGVPDYPQAFNPPSGDMPLEEYLKAVLAKDGKYYGKDNFTAFMPGQFFEYSNTGAALAALVVEKATGMSYPEFTAKYIFNPLGMKNSGWAGKNSGTKNHSLLYATPQKALPMYHLITYPDGGLVTSAADMGLYLQELIRGYKGYGKVLGKESYKQFFTTWLGPKSFIDGREEQNPYSDEYNSGLFIGFSPAGYIGHTGGDPGVSSLMFFDPKTGIGRYVVVNTDINDKAGNDAFYAIMDALGSHAKKLGQ